MRYKLVFQNIARPAERMVLIFTNRFEAGEAQDRLESEGWETVGCEIWTVKRKALISVG